MMQHQNVNTRVWWGTRAKGSLESFCLFESNRNEFKTALLEKKKKECCNKFLKKSLRFNLWNPRARKELGHRKESSNKASFWIPGSISCLSFSSIYLMHLFLSLSQQFVFPVAHSHSYLQPLSLFLRLKLPGEVLTLSGSGPDSWEEVVFSLVC